MASSAETSFYASIEGGYVHIVRDGKTLCGLGSYGPLEQPSCFVKDLCAKCLMVKLDERK